jgi:hypothetical protein
MAVRRSHMSDGDCAVMLLLFTWLAILFFG